MSNHQEVLKCPGSLGSKGCVISTGTMELNWSVLTFYRLLRSSKTTVSETLMLLMLLRWRAICPRVGGSGSTVVYLVSIYVLWLRQYFEDLHYTKGPEFLMFCSIVITISIVFALLLYWWSTIFTIFSLLNGAYLPWWKIVTIAWQLPDCSHCSVLGWLWVIQCQ